MRESLLWFAYFFFSLLFQLSSGFILSFVEERREKREGGGEMETGFISAREREREYSVFHFCHCHHTVDGRSLTAKDFDSRVLFFPAAQDGLGAGFLQPAATPSHQEVLPLQRSKIFGRGENGRVSSPIRRENGEKSLLYTPKTILFRVHS